MKIYHGLALWHVKKTLIMSSKVNAHCTNYEVIFY